MPKKKERFEHGPFGSICLWTDAKIKLDGKDILLENATQYRLFKGENEEKKGRKFKLTAEDKVSAKSWYDSMVYGGAKPMD
jgi:hypothetical protein